MKKYLIFPITVILSCLSWVNVQAEESRQEVKTWSMASPGTSSDKTVQATAQLKKALTAKATAKLQAAQAQMAQFRAQQSAATDPKLTSVDQNTQATITQSGSVTKAAASVAPLPKPQVATTAQNVGTTATKLSNAQKWQSKTSKATAQSKPLANMQDNGSVANTNWRTKVTQQKLKQLGYLTEPASGRMTFATEDALKNFQGQNKLQPTGKLDEITYRKVEWVAFCKSGIKNLSGTTVVREAAKYKGVKYVFGGTTPKGFDCSGYVQYVFKQLHAKVTRTADTQALEGVYVSQKQLKPGDLVFFSTYEPGASHVGIYAGSGRFWNATSSKGIALCGLQEDYWRTRYYGARRILVSNGETNK